jgi:hypothetical protein
VAAHPRRSLLVWLGSDGRLPVASNAASLRAETREEFFRAFVNGAGPKIVGWVAAGTIVLGPIRGIVGGVLGDLPSSYGVTWIGAFVVGSTLLFLGTRVLTPAARRLIELPQGPDFEAGMARLRWLTLTELAGFMVILGLMIAMRFGY